MCQAKRIFIRGDGVCQAKRIFTRGDGVCQAKRIFIRGDGVWGVIVGTDARGQVRRPNPPASHCLERLQLLPAAGGEWVG